MPALDDYEYPPLRPPSYTSAPPPPESQPPQPQPQPQPPPQPAPQQQPPPQPGAPDRANLNDPGTFGGRISALAQGPSGPNPKDDSEIPLPGPPRSMGGLPMPAPFGQPGAPQSWAMPSLPQSATEPSPEEKPSTSRALGGVSALVGAVRNVFAPGKAETPPAETKPAEKPEEKPAATTVVQSGAPLQPQPAPAKTLDLKKPIVPVGAAGGKQPPSAVSGRDRGQMPPANEKASISPTFLVELEKTNPALHDSIIQAASVAGVGAWDYANLIYATSKADPNFNQNGRVGYAGLTKQDIDFYQNNPAYAGLFKDAQGNPVSAQDPHTNLVLGAVKFRQMRDMYGAKTAQSLLAYHTTPGEVDAWSRLTPAEQRENIPPQAQAQVQQSVAGPDAGVVKPTPLTLQEPGTMTPSGIVGAAQQAARTGNTLPFIGYMANGLPRGMGSNDGWRYAENLAVSAMIAKGDMAGAQHARELIFQMSQVGATQSLMSAYKQMQMGDYHGAAQSLALGYWASPDGGLAQFAVGKDKNGKDVMYGQRYNEDTRKPVGPTFQVTPEGIMSMTAATRDPVTFQNLMHNNQKLHAELANKDADTEYKKAHTKVILSADRRADEKQDDAALTAVVRGTQPPKGAAASDKPDPRLAHLDKEVETYYLKKDPTTGAAMPWSPVEEFEVDMFRNLRSHNDSLSAGGARGIANDLATKPSGGRYMVRPSKEKQGWGDVVERRTGVTIGRLDPTGFSRFRPAVAPGIGAR